MRGKKLVNRNKSIEHIGFLICNMPNVAIERSYFFILNKKINKKKIK